MSLPRPAVRSHVERNVLVERFLALPPRVVKDQWFDPAVRALGADEATQVGYMALLRAAELWEESRGVKFISYAYRAIWHRVRHHARDLYRKQRGTQLREDVPDLKRHTSLEMREALSALPDNLQQIVWAADVDEMSYTEVAKHLGLNISKERVRQLRTKALNRLSISLGGRPPATLRARKTLRKMGSTPHQERNVHTE